MIASQEPSIALDDATKQAPSLGELRDELRLFEGPNNASGAPTWTLEDPVNGRFYRLGWLEMEILARWSLDDVAVMVEQINQQSALEVDAQDIHTFAAFLRHHSLLKRRNKEDIKRLLQERAQRKMSPFKWLLKNYLFIRVPICSPDRFLERTLPVARFIASKTFLLLTMLVALVGVFLVSRQWDTFTHTFSYFFSFEGAAMMGVALFFTKLLHELGHAYTCKLFGARVATMGVAFLVMWPVLYTDTSGAWRLKNKRQRLMIASAGVAAELLVAGWAIFLWSFLPEGIGRSLAFMLGTSTWVLSMMVNLSPFMRFDGYFLFSDLLNMPNLQSRAFALTRWQLREWLFAFKETPPEYFSPLMGKVLLLYSFGTWVYRLFLYLGIALVVYHFAFKVLGLLLFAVEIVFFVLWPIMKEVKEWLARRSSMSVNKSTILSTSVLLLGLLMFFIPWRTEVVVSGVLHAEKQASIFVPDDAQLVERQVTRQARVAKGQPLFRFYSPELTQAAQSLRQHIRSLEKQQDVNPFDQEAATGLQVVREALFSAREQLTVIERQIEALTVVAPFDGVMAEMSDQFNDGSWLASGEWLGTLISPHQQTVEAFLEERDLSRVSVGNSARFIPENMQVKRLPLRVTRIEQAAISSLSSAPELASIHGGDIATKAPRGEHSGRFPLVENALYRVFLTPLKNGNVRTQPFVMRGKVVIEGKAQSIASRLFKRVLAVLVRESSF